MPLILVRLPVLPPQQSAAQGLSHLQTSRVNTPEDFILAGYSRSGSAWLAFMMSQTIWKVGRENTLGGHRFTPFLGYYQFAETRLPGGGRIVASHEPYRREYKNAVWILRDPRDNAVSTYYHVQRVMGLKGTFSEYLPLYVNGTFNGSRWCDYVRSWLDSPLWATGSIVRVKFEDLKANPAGELRRAVEITGYQPTEDEIEDGIDAGSLDAMKRREQASHTLVHRESSARINAVRKGQIGDWRNHFTKSDLDKFYAVNGAIMEQVEYSTSLEG
jgi:hypothetical protein